MRFWVIGFMILPFSHAYSIIQTIEKAVELILVGKS